jgi:hypothetical protein
MTMISTTQDHILIHKGFELAWAMKVFETPIYLNKCDIKESEGLIVALTDTGNLTLYYLGTNQIRNFNTKNNQKELDLEYVSSETERLTNLLDNYESGIFLISNETLNISAAINSNLIYNEAYDDFVYFTENGKIVNVITYLISVKFAYNLTLKVI